MRIAFDAKRALNNGTGLGNYSRILLNALMRDNPGNEYLLFSPVMNTAFFGQLKGNFKLHFPESLFSKAIHPWWRSYGITYALRRSSIDVYHGLSNELPMNIHRSRIKSVVTIHDLIFLKHKEQYPFIDRKFYISKTKYACRHADLIIAVSEETKRDIMDLYQIPERKIRVVYQSADSRFSSRASEKEKTQVSTKYGLPKKFILHVGSFFPRKNQNTLIEAYSSIQKEVEQKLVLVGSVGQQLHDIKKQITEKGLGESIAILEHVNTEDLPVIYQMASAFVFPSLFEGFGIPVLEALMSGAPVIASNSGAIAEAAGSGSILVNPQSAADIAEKIKLVLLNDSIRQGMIEAGYHHAGSMTDSSFAANTMKVYREI